jgi:hypothetical protein
MLTLGAGQTEHDDLSHERKTFCRGPQNRELGLGRVAALKCGLSGKLIEKKGF